MCGYDEETGLPVDKTYLERGLPDWLQNSIDQINKSWAIKDAGQFCSAWDLDWCELNADIGTAEVEGIISPEQAWYLREKYLRMARREDM